MAKSDYSDLEQRLSKAKTSLILDHPFVGTIALNMPFIISDTVEIPGVGKAAMPTACTDGKRVVFNPEFIRPLTDDQLLFLAAHECLHPMLEHNFRRGARDPWKFNAAADYVINQLLTDDNIGKFIPGGCLDKNIYEKGGGTTEGIYSILPDPPEDQKGYVGMAGGKGQKPYDNVEDGGGTNAERTMQQAEWKVKVAQASQAAKMMGKMSANMQRLVDDIMKPKVDWREVLRKFVEKVKTDNRTFARPNRRFISQGLILPTVSGEALGEIAFAIDCSGSIGQEEINQFSAEIHAVKEEGNPVKIHLVYFDSEVCHYEGFGRDDDLHVEMHGGGGTAFSPVFRYMNKNQIEPIACIFLTDLCCNDFGPQPEYPVLWVSTMEGTAPWGEIVLMDEKR